MKMADDYELIDSGGGRKFERFGRFTLVRPCSQALWRPENPAAWARASATFDREEGNRWHGRSALPAEWTIETAGIRFKLSGTDFGHLGIFPEQRAQWNWIRAMVGARGTGNGERGMGNGERGMGNGERGMGNGGSGKIQKPLAD